MGTTAHDCVIATFSDDLTSYDEVKVKLLAMSAQLGEQLNRYYLSQGWTKEQIVDRGDKFGFISPLMANGYFTVMLYPDGSKLGWEVSRLYRQARKEFVEFCAYKRADVIRLQYGEEGFHCKQNIVPSPYIEMVEYF